MYALLLLPIKPSRYFSFWHCISSATQFQRYAAFSLLLIQESATDKRRQISWLAACIAFTNKSRLELFFCRRSKPVIQEQHRQALFLSFSSCVKCLQRIYLSVPLYYLPPPALDVFLPVRLGEIDADKPNVLRLLSTRQEIVWDVLKMRLYPSWVIECLVVAEMRERFRVLFKLWPCQFSPRNMLERRNDLRISKAFVTLRVLSESPWYGLPE